MTRSDRLQPVVRITEAGEQEAARALALARDALAQQEAKLAELRGYLQDYLNTLLRESDGAVSSDRLQEYSQFLSRLNVAIAGQQRKVNEAGGVCEQRRLEWLQVRTRVMALEKVVDECVKNERREADRREQQRSDEQSLRRRPTPSAGE
jgi:flagellar FliJ protein